MRSRNIFGVMSFVVEMVSHCEDPGHRLFSCSNRNWEDFQQLGRTYGWKPAGTKPTPRPHVDEVRYMDYFRPDYHPDQWEYAKTVDAADARAWAMALRRAATACRRGVESGQLPQTGTAGRQVAPRGPRHPDIQRAESLEQFARFLSSGDFNFAWDR